ncbi:unnamed protein product [Bursaphelenchus xylophilus]|uniref:non-specific serine/threonine protein kinase n=1 Tax=Bursaphelenchus xylophilus TaxID=6326 RepID=A0A1I7RVS0_BURXY|nr:unnamed protein product [Bursaphelenchus xylophilus]CAG9082082.1 unnamed protein product [Bursaphelenchus xylophilus]
MGSRRKINEIDDSFEQFAASLREAADVDSQDQITSRGYESEEGWSCRLKDYVFEFILGTGAFGDVIKARNLAEKKDCAVKLLNYRVSSKRHILDEIKAMSRLSHPNLVGKYSVSVINRSTIFIVMPLLWNLRKLCEESRELRLNMARLYAMASITQLKPVSPVSENCAGQIVHQLLTGLDFMHKNRYIHRDLKSGNLLVSNKGTVKIGDFGLTKQFETGHFKLGEIKTPVGTSYYMAPEIALRFVKVSEKPYDIRAETWSIGAIMCELLLNCLPFAHYPAHAEGMVKTLKAATKEKHIIWELMFPPRIYEGIAMDLSPACRDFIDKCLVGDPAQRKTCSELLKNSWVKKFKGKKDVIQEELLDDEIKKGVIGKLKAMNGKFLAHNGGARRPLNVNMLFNPMGTRVKYVN